MRKKKILLAEDDPNFGRILTDYLALNNYDVTLAKDGVEGFIYYKNNDYDLIILDVMMPRKDGFSLAADIRKKDKDTPIIFLSARTLKEDVLKGYKVGADDYLTKPFDSEVLLYKINAIFNRSTKTEKEDVSEYRFGNFVLDSKLRLLKYKNEEPQKLSPKENKLLKLLLDHKNDLMPRQLALLKIWRDDTYFTSRSMDVYIAKLRKYLKKDPSLEIVNIHGEGFRLVVKENEKVNN